MFVVFPRVKAPTVELLPMLRVLNEAPPVANEVLTESNTTLPDVLATIPPLPRIS